MSHDCIFCKITQGTIPCHKIYEDEHTLAFLDINPVHPGHTLVIPKKHYINVFDMPADIWQAQTRAVHTIAPAVRKGTGCEGITLSMANEKAAGQEVFHAHMHIIPRFSSDELKLWPQKKYSEGHADEIKRKIIASLQ